MESIARLKMTLMIAVAGAALVLTAGGVATAAQADQAPMQDKEPAASGQPFTESELQTFASAAAVVQEINVKQQEELQKAETAEERQQVAANATEEKVAAVQDTGLSLDRYNQILVAVEQDPALREKVTEMMAGE